MNVYGSVFGDTASDVVTPPTIIAPAQILGSGGSWYQERTAEFEDLITDDLFGTTLEYNGVSFPCIGPPQEQIHKMTQGPYESNRPAQFSMRRSDFVVSGIANRSVIKSNGLLFEVYSYLDDPKEPTIDLQCHLKQ